MKVGVFGHLYVTTKIKVKGKFEEVGPNSGQAIIEYGGRDLDLMAKLSQAGHDVYYIGTINTSAGYYITKKLQHLGISCEYMLYSSDGLGFSIDYKLEDDTHNYVDSIPPKDVIRHLVLSDTTLYDNFDAVVHCYTDSTIWKRSLDSGKECYYYLDEYDMDYVLDEGDINEMSKEMIQITLNNYSEVMR